MIRHPIRFQLTKDLSSSEDSMLKVAATCATYATYSTESSGGNWNRGRIYYAQMAYSPRNRTNSICACRIAPPFRASFTLSICPRAQEKRARNYSWNKTSNITLSGTNPETAAISQLIPLNRTLQVPGCSTPRPPHSTGCLSSKKGRG